MFYKYKIISPIKQSQQRITLSLQLIAEMIKYLEQSKFLGVYLIIILYWKTRDCENYEYVNVPTWMYIDSPSFKDHLFE